MGAAVRRRFGDGGAEVIGVDLDQAEVIGDLSTPDGRASAVSEVLERSGGSLDAVVACAGIGPHTPEVPRIAAVNYFGALGFLDGLLPALQDGEDPVAVAIVSNSLGIIPRDDALVAALLEGDEQAASAAAASVDGVTAYGNSKYALAVAVRRRAAVWGEAGVRLNGVAPGPVDTPLLQATIDDPVLGPHVDDLPMPLGRRGAPEEIAGIVAFLLSDAAALVHGSIVFADGGTDAVLRPDAV
ncbi:MAG: SDR family oxidoreductase [Actinobacteria bacterium]|nr:MAG: SDR family oxidoreductase [Actinomycetota bacterium]RIK06045.1 MAG: 3-alpha-hydroxysteroid dehydrogenase [Acidobacteriota bacterium]